MLKLMIFCDTDMFFFIFMLGHCNQENEIYENRNMSNLKGKSKKN